MSDMPQALTCLGYTPDPCPADWSIDARLYTHRTWERGGPAGIGAPVAAMCLRLHQPSAPQLWWLVEYPAGLADWPPPDPGTSILRMAVLGDATLPLHPSDLGLLQHLLGPVQEIWC